MANKLGDYNSAVRLARFVRKVADRRIDQKVLKTRYGTVTGINRFFHQCYVQIDGDDDPTTVKMYRHTEPIANGDRVQLDGPDDGMYISRIVGAAGVFNRDTVLVNPTIQGGTFYNVVQESRIEIILPVTPAVGNAVHVGRWDAETVVANPIARLSLDIQVRAFNPWIKHYEIPISYGGTSGAWAKVFPETFSGVINNDGWELEILIDTLGFELRLRHTVQHTNAFGTLAPYATGVIVGNNYIYEGDSSQQGETSAVPPTITYGVGGDFRRAPVPMGSPERNLGWKMQSLVSGGGLVTFDGTTLFWTQRFVTMGVGYSNAIPLGYFSIPPPVAGVTIPVVNNSSAAAVVSVANGIPLSSWRALYYEPPLGSGGSDANPGATANFRIVEYGPGGGADTYGLIPPHWILVGMRNNDLTRVLLGTGGSVDAWHQMSGAYAATFADASTSARTGPAFYKDDEGWVHFEGGLNCTAVNAGQVSIGKTVPAGLRPGFTVLSPILAAASTGAGISKMQITTAGVISISNSATGVTYISSWNWLAEN